MAAACEGLRVLDLSWGPAGGVATMVLADFGAEVIKIEPPGGDPFRGLAAAPVWLRGKRSLILDLKTAAGVARLHELAADADVLVQSYRPGVAERLKADYATLNGLNPQLVYCAITGFGAAGPYRDYKGYEGLAAAKSGRMMAFAGQIPRPGPVYAAVQVATHATAQATVQGLLAALLVRKQTGRGQLVETSLLQGMLPYDLGGLLTQQLQRRLPAQFPGDALPANRQPTLQYQPVLTADGRWLQLGNLIEHLFHAFIAAAGLSNIYTEPAFENAPYLNDEGREALRLRILARMRERTLDEWMETFVADGNVAAEPIVSTQAALCHPQALYAGHAVETVHPRLGRMRQIGLLATLPQTPGAVSCDSAKLGDADEYVWTARKSAGATDAPANSRPPRHPLEGITAVEFASIIATPLACSILADLGARVIKVEALEGDGYRKLGNGIGAAKTTAGKESICADLKTEAGRRIARQLIARADLLIHNFRPGVPERLGIGYDEVREYNPQIVYVSATGYGSDGPYAHRPSAHPIAGALAGGAFWQAGAAMPPPEPATLEDVREIGRRFFRANEVNPDPNSAAVIATAAMLGLYARRVADVGQHVQTNMLIANAYANFDDFCDYEGKPQRPLVDAELFGLHALYRLYEAETGWIFLACPFEAEWQRLCRALGRGDLLSDCRFTSPELRRQHDGELAALLREIFCTKAANNWEALLTKHDVGCVRADLDTPATFWDRDNHVLANGFVREAEHLRWGPYWRFGPLVHLSETPGRYGAGVLAGQQTRQILRELGYGEDEILDLYSRGVVRSEEP